MVQEQGFFFVSDPGEGGTVTQKRYVRYCSTLMSNGLPKKGIFS